MQGQRDLKQMSAKYEEEAKRGKALEKENKLLKQKAISLATASFNRKRPRRNVSRQGHVERLIRALATARLACSACVLKHDPLPSLSCPLDAGMPAHEYRMRPRGTLAAKHKHSISEN